MSVVRNLHIGFIGKGKIIRWGLPICAVLASLIYTGLGISGCKNVDKVSDTLIFRYNEDATVASLDPAYIKSQAEIWVAQQLFNGLVELDSVLKPSPSLAKSWEILENGLVYKFRLRKGVAFHKHTSGGYEQKRWVTARDVVYSFNRLADRRTASPSAWIFAGKVAGDSLRKVRPDLSPFTAPDDSTFVLRLLRPDPTMLALLGTVYCSVIPADSGLVQKDFGHHPIGTGPFYLKLWEEDVKLVLRRNPEYFEFENGRRLPYLEAVNVDFIKNKQTAFMKFVSGEFDFFNGVEGSFKDELLGRDGHLNPKYRGRFVMLKKPFLNTEYIGFWLGDSLNGDRNPLKDIHLRKALALATDRHGLIRHLRNGLGDAGEGGFTPSVLLPAKVKGWSFNPSAAAEELKLAGYPGGKGLRPLTLTTTADYLDMAVYLKKSWADLGILVNVEVQTGGMLRQMRNKGQLGMFRGSWIADVPDAENYLACFYSANFSPGGPNYTHFSRPGFDRAYEKSILLTGEQRAGLMREADSLLTADAPVIVLYYDQSVRLMQNQVQGLGNDPSNRLILKRVRKRAKTELR